MVCGIVYSHDVIRVFTRSNERRELEVKDTEVLTRYVVGGEHADESPVMFGSALKAKWEADQMCRAWQELGFVRVDEGEDELCDLDFERALLDEPDDLEHRLVYGDWLAERGDPWGELILVQHALRLLPRFGVREKRNELQRIEMTLLFEHAALIWGRLGEVILDPHTQRYAFDLVQAKWECGFIREVEISDEGHYMDMVVSEFAALRVSRLLRSVHLGGLRWTIRNLAVVARQTWPLLVELVVNPKVPAYPAPLMPLLDGSSAPNLKRLLLRNCRNSESAYEALLHSPIARQLTAIEIAAHDHSDRGIDLLAQAPLVSLENLSISGVRMPQDIRERLAHLGAKLHIRESRHSER
tara:strand:+ start:24352 stop:25416 length:1065 start_codon:yes stop_codon:yes gene_type:complete